MKSFCANFAYAFLGGAIAAALWSMVTNYLRFGYVPMDPLLFAAAFLGVTHGLVYAIVHAVGNFRPTFVSATASAAGTLSILLVLSIMIGSFVGWSILSVGALVVLSGLIGWLTHIFVTEF